MPLPSSAADLTLQQRISLLSGQNAWQTREIPAKGINAIMVADGPHGLRMQPEVGDHLGLGGSHPATCFPTAVTLASSWDEDLLTEVGRALGEAASALGVSVILGPGLNIKRHPLCGRNFEYLSEDPLVSGRLASAMVTGIQSTGVGACLKHFAVNNQEAHRMVVDAVVDERTLREIYLAGFEYAVTHARPRTVMTSYNRINGPHATGHRELLTGILREEWGFDGLVMSDWGATADRVAAVAAGMDLEMPGSGGAYDGSLHEAIDAGELTESDVTACAQRVLDLVAASEAVTLGIDQPRMDAVQRAHDDLARRAAAQSAVLLANDGTLPLPVGSSIALIGAFAEHPRYQGFGSSHVVPTVVTTARQAFEDAGWEVTYAPGYDPLHSGDDARSVADAVAVAGQADVAVVMAGLPGLYESEGFDRDHLALPDQHDTLIAAVAAANQRTVVALSNGAPVAMPWREDVAAIVEGYLGGQASGGALVDVLTGRTEPGGRLAETFPADLADLAAHAWFPGRPHQVEYREGLAVGYRDAITHAATPLYPFGHGLGYVRTDWGEPTVTASGGGHRVRLVVTNPSDRTTSDVVQVYLHDPAGLVPRPRRWLAGFAKVHLAPGESRPVEIEVAERAFAHWDARVHDWRIVVGEYQLELGRSSTDIESGLTVAVEAGVGEILRVSADRSGGIDQMLVAASDAAFAARLGGPIPTPRPVTPFTRESTVGEFSSHPLGKGLRAIVIKSSASVMDGEDDPVAAQMLARSLEELPLRAAVLLSEGRLPFPVLDRLIAAANRTGFLRSRVRGG